MESEKIIMIILLVLPPLLAVITGIIFSKNKIKAAARLTVTLFSSILWWFMLYVNDFWS